MKNSKFIIQAHFAVFLFGCASLFGKFISLSAGAIVLGRAFIASIFLVFVLKITGFTFRLPSKKYIFFFCLNGIILALHWYFFFASIKLSTVSIGVITFSTFPIFTTLIEPFVYKQKIKKIDIILSVLSFLGISIILPDLDFKSKYTLGIVLGVLSGLTFAIISIISKKLTTTFTSNEISCYQNAIAGLCLLPIFGSELVLAEKNDIGLILLLGVIFTGIAHTLFINCMVKLKAKTASLIASLEPFYAIILSIFLLNETLNLNIIIGGSIIILVALFSSTYSD